MIFSLIVAYTQNRVLGKENKLVWKLPEDMKLFKSLTAGKVVLMGRKTFESIGKPLAGRYNVVITRDKHGMSKKYQADNLIFVDSFESYLEIVPILDSAKEGYKETVVIGGSEIYSKAISMNILDKLYLTELHGITDGDAFFPIIDFKNWLLSSTTGEQTDYNSYFYDDPSKTPIVYSHYVFTRA